MKVSRLPEPLKKLVRPMYYAYFRMKMLLFGIIYPSKITDPYKIPIIINNFNRLTYLEKLIDSLEIRGYTNIYIIDNQSTYPPLLAYYSQSPHKIFMLNKNFGYRALWDSGLYRQFVKDYYVYTDSDVVPVEACPNDFLKLFLITMKSDRTIFKVGLGLKTDDLPDHYAQKHSVLNWESQYYRVSYSHNFFLANVDTTFALYRPGLKNSANLYIKMLRSKAPYEARHLPWYVDSNNVSEEDMYYLDHAKKSTHWTAIALNQ